jgi:galactonate dehydratase
VGWALTTQKFYAKGEIMKITEIRSFLVDRYLLVRVYTDAGIIGNGEAGLWAHHGVVKQAIDELAEYYVGKDPRQIEHHFQVVSRQTHFFGAVLSAAMSAIDIALWDILGKSVELPVYQLLGGKCRDKIKVFNNIIGETLEARVASARAHVDNGYSSLRMTPFFSGFEEKTSSDVVGDAVAMVSAVREGIGYGVDLGLEIHRNLRIEEAITLARELEPFRILYYEDPLAPESVEGLEIMARSVRLPIATGERFYSIQQFKDLIDRKLVSLIRPDVSLAGGFTQIKKIAAIAEAAFVGIFPHLMGSPVNNAAFAHFAAAIPNYVLMESNLPMGPGVGIVDIQMPVEGGYRIVSDRPGIGVEINEDALAKFPQKKIPISGFFHADGSVAH